MAHDNKANVCEFFRQAMAYNIPIKDKVIIAGNRHLILTTGFISAAMTNTGKLKPKTKAILNSTNEKEAVAETAGKENTAKLANKKFTTGKR